MSTTVEKKEILITPKTGWLDIDWKELWGAREIIFRLFLRDLSSTYKQTIFGYLWFVIPPIVNTLMFSLIFGVVAKIPTDGPPHFIFFMASLLVWNYFSSCVTKTAGTFVGNAGMFKKVYFPRLSVVCAGVLTNLITLGVQMVTFAFFYILFLQRGAQLQPSWNMLLFPLLLVVVTMLGVGIGLIISSMTTTYRDLVMMATMALQLMMYASCVFYPLSQVPEKYKVLFVINPMVALLEATRHVLFGSGTASSALIASAIVASVVMLFIGILLFHRAERTFTDTV